MSRCHIHCASIRASRWSLQNYLYTNFGQRKLLFDTIRDRHITTYANRGAVGAIMPGHCYVQALEHMRGISLYGIVIWVLGI